MRLMDPDAPCLCGSGVVWAECCARALPLTLRYVPVRLLGAEDWVRTGCGRGGHCCRNVHVPLTPFDVLRLARLLELPPADLLQRGAVITPDGGVELDGDPECPFLEGNLCTVYPARPDSCRLYPFWRVPSGGVTWLVERHTCSGCWQECRGAASSAAEALLAAGSAEGQEAEAIYQGALRDLEDAGVPDEEIEQFMARAYEGDSVVQNLTPGPFPAREGEQADLPPHAGELRGGIGSPGPSPSLLGFRSLLEEFRAHIQSLADEYLQGVRENMELQHLK